MDYKCNTSEFIDFDESIEGILNRCEASCNYMITYVINSPDLMHRQKQLHLLRDAHQICINTAIFFSAASQFIIDNSHLCILICKVCAEECMRHHDQMSRDCAEECFYCAQALEMYISSVL